MNADRTESVRPMSDWTINYARKAYRAGLVTLADVAAFVALFGQGLTVAEVVAEGGAE